VGSRVVASVASGVPAAHLHGGARRDGQGVVLQQLGVGEDVGADPAGGLGEAGPLAPVGRAVGSSSRVSSRVAATASTATSTAAGVIDDLGRPERFLHMLRVFKVTSPLSVGSYILSPFSALASAPAGLRLLELKPVLDLGAKVLPFLPSLAGAFPVLPTARLSRGRPGRAAGADPAGCGGRRRAAGRGIAADRDGCLRGGHGQPEGPEVHGDSRSSRPPTSAALRVHSRASCACAVPAISRSARRGRPLPGA
jgi:hypothetical protein